MKFLDDKAIVLVGKPKNSILSNVKPHNRSLGAAGDMVGVHD